MEELGDFFEPGAGSGVGSASASGSGELAGASSHYLPYENDGHGTVGGDLKMDAHNPYANVDEARAPMSYAGAEDDMDY